VTFDNQDGAPHNVAISDASGASVYKGEIVSKTTVTYAVPALAAGTYTFICEVHPDMKGTITAQ
jgi:plastocyanin